MIGGTIIFLFVAFFFCVCVGGRSILTLRRVWGSIKGKECWGLLYAPLGCLGPLLIEFCSVVVS